VVTSSTQVCSVPTYFAAPRKGPAVCLGLQFVFGLYKFLTPWFPRALGTLVYRIANSKAVIAGSIGVSARKLFTFFAWPEELAFNHAVLLP
jgi:hypothetical protein